VDLGLKGKTVIVTGAGSNIGRGILLEFAKEGSRLVAAEKDEAQGMRVVGEANRLGGEAVMIRTDVTDWDSVQAMVRETLSRFGQIDVLVNNAGGTTGMAPFVKKKREEWDKEIKLNYWGVINCIRAVTDHMIERKQGRIVNIASAFGPDHRHGCHRLRGLRRHQGWCDRALQSSCLGIGPVRHNGELRFPRMDCAEKR
jgi:2-hydroxycyclohexanecarboxyl-CoA dehydrogenase